MVFHGNLPQTFRHLVTRQLELIADCRLVRLETTPLNHRIILFTYLIYDHSPFSALTLLAGWQEGHPACKKTGWWGAGVIICLEQGADLHMAQLTPLPVAVSCFSKIQIGFTFLVLAHPGSHGSLNRCACVSVIIQSYTFTHHSITTACIIMSLGV